jgi:hypothetical protein
MKIIVARFIVDDSDAEWYEKQIGEMGECLPLLDLATEEPEQLDLDLAFEIGFIGEGS